MLGAYHNRVNALWDAIVAVLYRHLTLSVWTKIGHDLAFFADIGQRTHDQMCQIQTDRHVVLCLVGGVAEHHALVASTLFVLITIVNTTVDIGTLLVDGTQDTT